MGSCASLPQLLSSAHSVATPSPYPCILVEKQQFDDIHELYSFDKELRRCPRSVLHRVRHKASGRHYACKSTNKTKLSSSEDLQNIQAEFQIIQRLSEVNQLHCSHIVQLVGCYEDQLQAHIVMEECTGCDLFELVKTAGALSEAAAAALLRAVLLVVQHCQSNAVVHRGIQPEAFIFLSSSPGAPIKAVDFGCATFLDSLDDEVVGSPHYLAPEMLRGSYGAEVDMWSVGVLMYVLLCGYPPFEGSNNMELFQEICSSPLNLKTEPWPHISAAGKDLVGRMLVRDTKKRITAKHALQHNWFVEQADLRLEQPQQQKAAPALE